MRTFAAWAWTPYWTCSPWWKPDPETDARARLRGLLAILTRAGVALPTGLTPGEPADRLREIARAPSRSVVGLLTRRVDSSPRPLDALVRHPQSTRPGPDPGPAHDLGPTTP
jgi:hypothetical protein